MIYTTNDATKILGNAYYAYANGTHYSASDIEELRLLILELINIKFEILSTVKTVVKK